VYIAGSIVYDDPELKNLNIQVNIMVLFEIKSQTNPEKMYQVIKSERDGVVYCTCMSWRFSGKNGAEKTCKHLRSVAIAAGV